MKWSELSKEVRLALILTYTIGMIWFGIFIAILSLSFEGVICL